MNKTIFTYLISDERYYKIGRSVNPEKRLKQISTGNPKAKLLNTLEGDYEKWLHDILSEYRIKNEWFEFTEAVLNLVNNFFCNNKYELKIMLEVHKKALKQLESKNKNDISVFNKINCRSH